MTRQRREPTREETLAELARHRRAAERVAAARAAAGLPAEGPALNGTDRAAAAMNLVGELAKGAGVEPDGPGEVEHLRVVRLSDVAPERPQPLWPGRIWYGKVSLLDGDPGIAKSTVMVDISARLTRGLPMPDGSQGTRRGPQTVLFLTAEDGLADTVRPRLDAAGGDPSRVIALPGLVLSDGTERLPELPTDIGPIQEVITSEGVALVVVDVLMSFLADAVETRSDHKVRRALGQLYKMAEDTGAAVTALRHLNKSGGANPLYRGGGSIAFSGQARSVMLAAADPGDETGERRVLAVVKCNVAKIAPSLTYTVTEADNGAGRIVWGGESAQSAADLLAMGAEAAGGSAVDHAADILRQLMADGPVSAAEAEEARRQNGVSTGTWARAKDTVGVISGRRGARWEWRLATASDEPPNGPRFQDSISESVESWNLGMSSDAPSGTGVAPEAGAVQEYDPSQFWVCACGKTSMTGECWNCKRSRPADAA